MDAAAVGAGEEKHLRGLWRPGTGGGSGGRGAIAVPHGPLCTDRHIQEMIHGRKKKHMKLPVIFSFLRLVFSELF